MKTYVAPIGYNPTSVTRPVLSHGLDDGDAVTLFRPARETDDRRAKETLSDIDRLLGELEPDVTVTTVRLPHDDFPAAALTCSDALRDAAGAIIAIFGGGARDVFLPLVVASLTHIDRIETVLTFSDIDGAVRELTFPALTANVPDATWETLAAIAERTEASIPELTDSLPPSKSTVARHVTDLSECGAVETWSEGKTKHARISLTGQLLLRTRSTSPA